MNGNSLAIGSLVFLSLYSYFIYPLVLLVARRVRGPTTPPSRALPPGAPEAKVSLIITAFNEQERIRAKIENSLELAYPRERLEIIVASDASTDRTDAIVAEFPGVKLVRVAERKGKEHAQKRAILESSGSLVIFTDVATLLDPDAVDRLAAAFRDPGVGAISSTDRLLEEDGSGSGEGLYVRYEMLLRRLESQVNGLVGMSGSFFAARREVCSEWAANLPSDFNTVMSCVRHGYRAISDESVIGYYRDIQKGQSEFARKVRTLVRGITAFFANLELLDFRRFGFFSFQLLSHKLMRWLVPFFMLLLLPVTLAGLLRRNPLAALAAALQAAFYVLAWRGHLSPASRAKAPVKVAYFFTQANLAILAAWIKYWRGERISMWTPSRR